MAFPIFTCGPVICKALKSNLHFPPASELLCSLRLRSLEKLAMKPASTLGLSPLTLLKFYTQTLATGWALRINPTQAWVGLQSPKPPDPTTFAITRELFQNITQMMPCYEVFKMNIKLPYLRGTTKKSLTATFHNVPAKKCIIHDLPSKGAWWLVVHFILLEY